MGSKMGQYSKPKILVEPPGPKAKALIERDRKILSPSLSRTASLVGEEAQGVLIKDVDGNVFLDFGAGIAVANVGHCHPEVSQAIVSQATKCDHVNSCDYYTVPQIEFAESLQKLMPVGEPFRFFFGNSGSEAVECAIKLARYHSKRPNFIGYIRGFHGRTMGSLTFTSTSNSARKYFGPFMPSVYHAPYPYCYRCPMGNEYDKCDMACLHYIEEQILKYLVNPQEVAGVILEPILGAGGYVIPPDGYWRKIKRLCADNNILFIADEVQTGFGRTGKMWATEHWDLQPDIMCMSKAVAAGLPLGICAAKSSVMDWDEGAHENTLGGNPIIMSAAKAVLNVIIKEKLVENSKKVGDYIRTRFMEMSNRVELIGDVRGKGLMIGIELVIDRKTKKPATKERDRLIDEAFRKGLLLLGAGPSSIRLAPPLVLTMEQADMGLEIFEKSIKQIS